MINVEIERLESKSVTMLSYTIMVLLCLTSSEAYKILLINPVPMKSMNILAVGYVRHLLKAGHEVTYVTSDPMRNMTDKNYHEINISSIYDLLAEDKTMDVGYLMQQPLNEDGEIDYLQNMAMELAFGILDHEAVRKLLEDPEVRFDAVITDFFETEIYAALATYFDCPMIWAFSLGAHWTTLKLIDAPTNPAYALDYLTPDIPPLHSMSTRVKKLWAFVKWYLNKWYKTKPLEKAFYEQYFTPLFLKKGKVLPDYDTVIYNGTMVLGNDFVGNGLIPSLPQNYKLIGGYHIDGPPKPLSGELKRIVDNAEHGFIFFSMGSNWKSKDIPEHVKKGLLEMFSRLKVTVIWKLEIDFPNLPKNVHIVPWAPQQSILAHPKCLFFISHSGLLSTLETVHFGVPTIGIPIYYDQFININRGVQAGRSIKVDLTLNLVEDLSVAIHKMLKDPTYKENAMKLSQIYHDRPVSPGKELVHWVEHVIRTGGAPHLRSPESMMSWSEKLYLDVLMTTLVLVLIIQYLVRRYFSVLNTLQSVKVKVS